MNNQAAVPAEAEHALQILVDSFKDTLIAVYLHGSAVVGGLKPNSDVDLLVVVNQPTTHSIRESLVSELMQISGQPADPNSPRPLELIIFNQADLIKSHYPARAEFIYGEWLREEFQAGEVPHPGFDPEFTVLLVQARETARTLFGQEPAQTLPIIPATDLLRAISEALPALIKSLEGDERNVLLTLARMWVTVMTGKIVSKDVAAEWAMARLPPEVSATIAWACAAYVGLKNDDWTNQGARVRQTADYIHREISDLLSTKATFKRHSFENEINALSIQKQLKPTL